MVLGSIGRVRYLPVTSACPEVRQASLMLIYIVEVYIWVTQEMENHKTRKGRAANRRVEITLLMSELDSTPGGSAQKQDRS
jgi:hypothetical protein